MRARAVASAFLLTALSASAQDTVDLRVKLSANDSWKVEQTVEMTANFKQKPGTPVATGDLPVVKTGARYRETWVDKCAKDVEGRPTMLRRTWEVSEISAGGRAMAPTTMKGVTLKLEETEKEGNCVVTSEKGKPDQVTVNALAKAPAEAIVLLLPKGAVKVGEEWAVQAFHVHQFLRAVTSSTPGASREHLGDLVKVIENLKVSTEGPFGAELKGKVTSVDKDTATIEYAGRQDAGSGTTEIAATLTWSVSKRQPAALTWTQKKTVRADADRGTAGWSEEWKISRTWK